MNEIRSMIAEEITKDAPPEDDAATQEIIEKLAKQLRDMIKEGMSDECSICLSEFDKPVITMCGHVYCHPCITEHIRKENLAESINILKLIQCL